VAGSLLDHDGALDPTDFVLHPTEGPPMMKGHPKVHQISVRSLQPSGSSEGTGTPSDPDPTPRNPSISQPPRTFTPSFNLTLSPVYPFLFPSLVSPHTLPLVPVPSSSNQPAPLPQPTKIVIISIGINNKDDDPERTTTKQLNSMKKYAAKTFPRAPIYIPLINHSPHLTPVQTRNILTLNNFVNKNHNTLPTISPETFRTGQDNIHWTPPTAQLILDS
ncbi:hypothetical protein KUCAC02_019810, partial [Chaenocephalus aceratus]